MEIFKGMTMSSEDYKSSILKPKLSYEEKERICQMLELPMINWNLRIWSMWLTLLVLLPVIIYSSFTIADAMGYIRIL